MKSPQNQIAKDGDFISYSIEFADFHDFSGNQSLSIRMLENLANISGIYPQIRIGGTTSNHATFVSDQVEDIIPNFTLPGADQPASLTWGPSWLENFKNFPVRYTLGLSFDSGIAGERKTLDEAQAAYEALGETLESFEVGNEFDVFPVDRDLNSWDMSRYTQEWLERTEAIGTRVLGEVGERRRGPLFQAGAFVVPGSLNDDSTWTPINAFRDGIASTARTKNFAEHQCQGLANVSDVFGAALWATDYALYTASLNVTRMFFHMGVGYRYAAWQPRINGTTLPGPRPLYYSNLLVAEALAGGGKQVEVIANETSFAAYAVYNQARPGREAQLQHVVLINLSPYYAALAKERPSLQVQLLGLDKRASPIVKRLTAPSVEAKDGIRWAGRRVNDEGKFVGGELVERLRKGIISVPASQIVMVSFENEKGHSLESMVAVVDAVVVDESFLDRRWVEMVLRLFLSSSLPMPESCRFKAGFSGGAATFVVGDRKSWLAEAIGLGLPSVAGIVSGGEKKRLRRIRG
ncbi:Beta-glucuronidase [Paramyrothecium foliicola]|nr:Beta-glucuronidase [Paramyrothecium foliicola]